MSAMLAFLASSLRAVSLVEHVTLHVLPCAAVALPRALLILLAVAHRDPDRSEPRAFVARRGSRAPERVQRACVYACGHSRERGRSDLEDTKPGHVWACARREKVETPREDHH